MTKKEFGLFYLYIVLNKVSDKSNNVTKSVVVIICNINNFIQYLNSYW